LARRSSDTTQLREPAALASRLFVPPKIYPASGTFPAARRRADLHLLILSQRRVPLAVFQPKFQAVELPAVVLVSEFEAS
jgi:hypothetical protein